MVFAIHQHELATDIHVCPLLDPSPTSLLTTSLWVAPSFVCPASRIKLELAIYFTYGNVHVSMLFSQIIPPSAHFLIGLMGFFFNIELHELFIDFGD